MLPPGKRTTSRPRCSRRSARWGGHTSFRLQRQRVFPQTTVATRMEQMTKRECRRGCNRQGLRTRRAVRTDASVFGGQMAVGKPAQGPVPRLVQSGKSVKESAFDYAPVGAEHHNLVILPDLSPCRQAGRDSHRRNPRSARRDCAQNVPAANRRQPISANGTQN